MIKIIFAALSLMPFSAMAEDCSKTIADIDSDYTQFAGRNCASDANDLEFVYRSADDAKNLRTDCLTTQKNLCVNLCSDKSPVLAACDVTFAAIKSTAKSVSTAGAEAADIGDKALTCFTGAENTCSAKASEMTRVCASWESRRAAAFTKCDTGLKGFVDQVESATCSSAVPTVQSKFKEDQDDLIETINKKKTNNITYANTHKSAIASAKSVCSIAQTKFVKATTEAKKSATQLIQEGSSVKSGTTN